MIVIGPCVLMGTSIREGFVIGRGSFVFSGTRSPKRGRLPFRVEWGANPVEETAAGIEGAKAGSRGIVRGKASNSSAYAGSGNTGINGTARITSTVISYITR